MARMVGPLSLNRSESLACLFRISCIACLGFLQVSILKYAYYTARGPYYISLQHLITGQLNYHMFGHQQNYNFLQLNHFIYVVWCFAARFE